ncbi:MAG: hypothetical protein GY898_27685 [Proteobacteria bacterium]|nr:hypothetical protein [Pseudomonadota bacterium]
MPESQTLPLSESEPLRRDLLPEELGTLYTGPDGHLYLAHGDGRQTTRLTWAPEDFAVIPGLPPIPGVAGDLEEGHVFAHPTPSKDGQRVAVFGLLPTLEEDLWDYDGDDAPWEMVEEEFPYLEDVYGEDGDGDEQDDVLGDGVVIAVVGEAAPEEVLAEFEAAEAEDEGLEAEDDDDELPQFWPGGKVYVVHRDGVRVWEPFEMEGGNPTHLEWAPDDRHLLILHQDEELLQLHLVDAEQPGEGALLHVGAPIFWSWQPTGRLLATRIGLAGAEAPLVVLSDPLSGHPAPREIAEAGSFYVPAWKPDGSQFAFGAVGSRDDELTLCDPHTGLMTTVMPYPGRGAFRWSPNGSHIAAAIAPEGHGAFDVLELLDPVTGESKTLWQAQFVAIEWLPGGQEILLCEAQEENGRLRWVVVNAESGISRPVGPSWAPSRETVVALHFFEQVAVSHPFVDPTGNYVVYAGVADGEVLSAGPGEDPQLMGQDEVPSRILVTPLDGGPTVVVGGGRFGCFAR